MLGTGITIYLFIGIMFASFVYCLLINDDCYYEDEFFSKKINVIIMMLLCILFWILFVPQIIYNNLKEEK